MTSSGQYQRHTLAHITEPGRERLLAEMAAPGQGMAAFGQMLFPQRYGVDGPPVPGIIRREDVEPSPGYVPVGFATWTSGDTGRLRVAAFVRPEEIAELVTPFKVLRKQGAKLSRSAGTPALRALASLRDKLAGRPLDLGVWGSAGLELETGHPYTHQGSDLDILLRSEAADTGLYAQTLGDVLQTEQEYGLRIDPELALPSGYGVSLKELLGGGKTVLGKGPRDVTLIQIEDVFSGNA